MSSPPCAHGRLQLELTPHEAPELLCADCGRRLARGDLTFRRGATAVWSLPGAVLAARDPQPA